MFKKLWNDQTGVIISSEIVLIATIMVIGSITGLATLRDAVVTELADVGGAIGNFDQSFTVGGVTAHSAASTGFFFFDTIDFCDTSCSPVNSGTRCLTILGTGTGIVGFDTGSFGTTGH